MFKESIVFQLADTDLTEPASQNINETNRKIDEVASDATDKNPGKYCIRLITELFLFSTI